METKKKVDFAKLFLRSQLHTLSGGELEQRKRITALLKEMRKEGYTHEQIAEIMGKYLNISAQPGQTRVALQQIYQETFINFILMADRRDKACLNCPLRTLPFSVELDYTNE